MGWGRQGKERQPAPAAAATAWAPAAQSLVQKWTCSDAMKLAIWCVEMSGSFKHWINWWVCRQKINSNCCKCCFPLLGIFIGRMQSFQANPFNFKHLFVCFDAPRFVPATLCAIICWRLDPCSVILPYDVLFMAAVTPAPKQTSLINTGTSSRHVFKKH